MSSIKEKIGSAIKRMRKRNEKVDAIIKKVGVGGFVCRGFIWACIGGVAITAAFSGEQAQDQIGALDYVASHTGGIAVLILATIGIFCYAGWRVAELFYGLRDNPEWSKMKRLIDAYITPFASAIFYLTFAVSNIESVREGIKQSRGSSFGSWSASLGNSVVGKIFLTIAGIILFGVSVGWIIGLVRGTFKEEANRKRLEKHVWFSRFAYFTAYIGIIGRAFLFALLAALLMRTAFDDSPEVRKGGFGGAMMQLQTNDAGRAFLVILGIFLIIFGIWSIIMSRYKRYFEYEPHLIPTGAYLPYYRPYTEFKDDMKEKFNETYDKMTSEGRPASASIATQPTFQTPSPNQ